MGEASEILVEIEIFAQEDRRKKPKAALVVSWAMTDQTHCALVVDDDALLLLVSSTILQDAGFRPFEATTVSEALAVLETEGSEVGLLFTDVEMPGERNGFDLARDVARRWPHIEIVIASGRVTPGADDMPPRATFLSKPFSAEIIHDHLRRTLPPHRRPPALDAL
ncbi:response regulator [Brevundimonas huaxiensis]|uniref:response regulator n=1 Tax=Brevundimonas huaxiensis TaxID=2725493 RepID=UPI002938EBD2|nr:response regulator [Brevundimonas huaxiensis]